MDTPTNRALTPARVFALACELGTAPSWSGELMLPTGIVAARIVGMADAEDFELEFLPRFIDAQRTFHDGDPEPNRALWSTTDPVTLFAARGLVNSGTGPVTKTFEYVASTFTGVRDFEWEPLASGVYGDFAYTVALERYTNSRDGGPPEATELRATHVYRRENGQWRAVHRHADRRQPDREG